MNKEYFEKSKKRLEERFAVNKDKVINEMTRVLNEFWKDQQEIQREFKELEELNKDKKDDKVATKNK